MCVCSLRYPACNAHAPYCHLWPAPHYSNFPPYLINGTNFGKKSIEHKRCVLIFSTFFILKIIERDKIKKLSWSSRILPFMYTTLHVHYPSCTLPFMYTTLHVHYPSCTLPFMYTTLHYCSILMKLDFFDFFFKSLTYQISKKSV